MKHKEILDIPVGSQIVLSERVDRLDRATERNSIIGVLVSHDNHQPPFWRGLYWRKMEDTFETAPSNSPKKWYFVTTEMPQPDGTTLTVKSLVSGKNILGAYNAETKKMWEEREAVLLAEQAEQDRQANIIHEVRKLGESLVEQERNGIFATLSGIMGAPIDNNSVGISVYISQDSVRWLDDEKTRAVPTTSGSVNMSHEFFVELMEKMYASLDER